MINQDTLAKLRSFRLSGFVQALLEQSSSLAYDSLSFDERLSLLVDAESVHRNDRCFKKLLKDSNLPSYPTLDQVDFTANRGISKIKFLELCQATWISNAHNVIISGATGTGKTFLASVLATTACNKGKSVKYFRLYELINELLISSHEGTIRKFRHSVNSANLLIFDDWLLEQLSAPNARHILDILDKRFRVASCIFITQLPVSEWHKKIDDPTLADAILDRVVHDSVRLEMTGDSMRKITSSLKKENVASLRQP